MSIAETRPETTGTRQLFHHAVRSVVYGSGFLVLVCNPSWRGVPHSNEAFLVKGVLLAAYLFFGFTMGYHLWQTAIRLLPLLPYLRTLPPVNAPAGTIAGCDIAETLGNLVARLDLEVNGPNTGRE